MQFAFLPEFQILIIYKGSGSFSPQKGLKGDQKPLGYPTDHFTILELQNWSINFSELLQVCPSPDFKSSKNCERVGQVECKQHLKELESGGNWFLTL